MFKNKRIFLILLLVGVFWTFIIPGVRVANDFPWISQLALQDRFGWPQIWTIKGAVGLGEYGLAILWGWPLDLLYGFGAKLGFDLAVLQRMFGIIPYILIGAYSIDKLLSHLKIKGWGKFIGSLFYLLNTYVLLIIDGGQFSVALAYAIFPLAYLFVTKAVRGDITNKLLGGLVVAVLGFFDIRFVYILFLLVFFKFVYELFITNWKKWPALTCKWIISGVVIGIVFIGLNFYWILPAFLARPPELPAGYADVSQASFLSFATLGNAMLLLQPHWYMNVFGKLISMQPQFYLIPMLVFLAPVLNRAKNIEHRKKESKQRAKSITFWLVIALIGLFLVKGSLEPWEAFYPWVFTYVPGFSMFRDPTKFFFLVAISYSVLIGFTTMFLMKKFDWKLEIGYRKVHIISLLLTTYLLLLASPVWTGKMTGTFSPPHNYDQFISAAEVIENDQDFGRILYISSRPPMGYASPVHPSIEAGRLLALRPFALGTVGTYETMNYLREARYMGQLLDVSGVSYISYPYPDQRREELKEDNIEYYYAFLDQLSGLGWVDSVVNQPPAALIKTSKSQDHVFIATNKFNIVGSLGILNEMMEFPGFELANNMLVFVEDGIESGRDLTLLEFTEPYLLYNKSETDLVASFINQDRIVSPANLLANDPSQNEGGWWMRQGSDIIHWRSFLQGKYGIDNQDFPMSGGWAVAEGEKELQVRRPVPSVKGDILLARVMNSSKGGIVEFYSGENKIGEINTLIREPEIVEIGLAGYEEIPDQLFEYDKADLLWVEVGELPVDLEPITIKANGEINVINLIAYVHGNDWENYQNTVEVLSSQNKILNWNELTTDEKAAIFAKDINSSVSYERHEPTRYSLSVESDTFPTYLVFSETFDDGWKLRRMSDGAIFDPVTAYTFLNGFVLQSSGDYELFYEPQKYILPGLVVTTAFLAGIVIVLVRRRGLINNE